MSNIKKGITVRKNVDVVLTLYKRPEVLLKQLNALQIQTIKPRNIYLYQDGIDSYYEIKLKQDIREQFTGIKISNINQGVWERFKYAKEIVKEEYVCLFDDDTIPGKKWIENCLKCMGEKEGIYGTNGILLNLNTNYPYGNDVRVGWNAPNWYVAEVDFVGHAWFLKTEWLSFMFDGTESIRKYKHVGEDMCLSAKCLEHGIHTYVPEHLYTNTQLWGSIPKYGKAFGISSTAISSYSSNYIFMNNVLKVLRNEGWKCVAERDTNAYRKSLNSIKIEIDKIHNIIISELDTFLQNANHIYIYGAGKIAKIFFDYINKKKYTVEAFIVSNIQNEKSLFYCKQPILDIQNYNFSFENELVILGIDSFYHKEIRGHFQNIKNIQIYPPKDAVISYDELLKIIVQKIK